MTVSLQIVCRTVFLLDPEHLTVTNAFLPLSNSLPKSSLLVPKLWFDSKSEPKFESKSQPPPAAWLWFWTGPGDLVSNSDCHYFQLLIENDFNSLDMKEVRLASGSSVICRSGTAEGSYLHLLKSGKGRARNQASEGKDKEKIKRCERMEQWQQFLGPCDTNKNNV